MGGCGCGCVWKATIGRAPVLMMAAQSKDRQAYTHTNNSSIFTRRAVSVRFLINDTTVSIWLLVVDPSAS